MTVDLVFNTDNIMEEFKDSSIFHLIDDRTYKGKKEAWKIKGKWAARMTPFAVVYDDEEKPVKVFYSEAGDVISQLKEYLLKDVIHT